MSAQGTVTQKHKPVYAVVDLEKKKRDRTLAGSTHSTVFENMSAQEAVTQKRVADLEKKEWDRTLAESTTSIDEFQKSDFNSNNQCSHKSEKLSAQDSQKSDSSPSAKVGPDDSQDSASCTKLDAQNSPPKSDSGTPMLVLAGSGKRSSLIHKYEYIDVPSPVHDAACGPESIVPKKIATQSYTLISKESLDSPTHYEYSNITVSAPKNAQKLSLQKWFCFVIGVIMILLITILLSSCFTIIFIEVFDLKSKQSSAVSNFVQTSEELKANLSTLNSTINHIFVNDLNQLKVLTQHLIDTVASLGQPSSPSASCAALLAFFPSSPSGYYWVRASNGSAVRVYCDMTRSCGGVTGGWTRVAELDMTNSTNQCPRDLRLRNDSNVRTCGVKSLPIIVVPTCNSATFDVKEIHYSKICGQIRAYQLGSPEAFHLGMNIDDVYVDGVSLTHGYPRQHIWTFAAASNELSINCPCSNTPIPQLSFVGGDYFCDTARQEPSDNSQVLFDNPLWDGIGCSPNNTCCSYNNPPWFYKQLPQPTTDNIEIRVCVDESRGNEDIAIEAFEIYVQ